MKILAIEDDPDILEVMSLSFRTGWPQAIFVSTDKGTKGIEMVETESPDIVLLDLLLPDMNGFDVLSEIRTFSNVPVIIVSVKVEEMERVRGLEMGADDYICKPFSYMELLARVRAVLRRGGTEEDASLPIVFDNGGLVINFRSQEVRLHDMEINLTPIEYRLLCQLAINSGKTVSHQTLIEKVWGQEYLNTPGVLKVHIHRLRRKLGDNPEHPTMITTVPRRGYRFNMSTNRN
ncbi:MAG: DNA-binding response regulator [Chloroflexi bacterium]|nr:MAG: DNA-binding response regulator [Chloroflexota bacterium]RLC96939.1 MAG: DNA-binding response regulator [Chloroflexota bacterium]